MGMEKILVGLIGGLFQAFACTICIKKIIDINSNVKKSLVFAILYIYFLLVSLFIPNQLRFILFICTNIIIVNIRNSYNIITCIDWY